SAEHDRGSAPALTGAQDCSRDSTTSGQTGPIQAVNRSHSSSSAALTIVFGSAAGSRPKVPRSQARNSAAYGQGGQPSSRSSMYSTPAQSPQGTQPEARTWRNSCTLRATRLI